MHWKSVTCLHRHALPVTESNSRPNILLPNGVEKMANTIVAAAKTDCPKMVGAYNVYGAACGMRKTCSSMEPSEARIWRRRGVKIAKSSGDVEEHAVCSKQSGNSVQKNGKKHRKTNHCEVAAWSV